MGKQIFLRLLILCVTLTQGFATLSNNGRAASSDPLVRKRRVVDRTPNAITRVRLRDLNYVVHVKEDNAFACAGTILSAVVVLVPCTCVPGPGTYTVISGTIATQNGRSSNVNGILRHPNYVLHSYEFNIALLSIYPHLTFGHHTNQPIPIANNQLLPNTMVRVSGYGVAVEHRGGIIGCGNPRNRGPLRLRLPNELRSIQLPTISAHDCRIHHNNDPHITPENVICTHHEDKYCNAEDTGSPLVYQGQLYGILSWHGEQGGPEVFVNLAFPARRNWIYENMNHIPHYAPAPPVQPPHGGRRRPSSQVHPGNN